MAVLLAISRYAIPAFLLLVPLYGWLRRVSVYECFVEGAAQGVGVALKILPFLLGMLLAINVFRVSGALDGLSRLLAPVTQFFGVPAEVLPLALLRPLSGNGALSVLTDLLNTYGADSYIGRLASIMQGSTDTTFYVLTVYFGSVGIKYGRHALAVGLFADFVSFGAANFFCRLFFG